MLSISRHIDEFDIAQEIRLEREVHKGSFLILEGDTDIKRFSAFIDDIECSTVNAYGKRNVIGALKILNNDDFAGVLACADADFDRLVGPIEMIENLLYSSTHDFDLDWVTLDTLSRYIREVADTEKLNPIGTVSALKLRIQEALKPVSVAKLLNRTGRLKYKVKHVDVGVCFTELNVEIQQYLDEVFREIDHSLADRRSVEDLIAEFVAKDFDLDQLTNGHDFYGALGASLRDDIGKRKTAQSWGREVAVHFRLAYQDRDFKSSQLYCNMRSWEERNKPFLILDNRLH